MQGALNGPDSPAPALFRPALRPPRPSSAMMRITSVLLVLFASASALPAQQSDRLSDHLPADTLFYFEVPDVAQLRDGLQGAAIGRIWQDEGMQAFLGDAVAMAREQFAAGEASLAEQGMPVEFLSWEAIRSVEFGVSMEAPTTEEAMANGPAMHIAMQVRFADGLAETAFELIASAAAPDAADQIVRSETGATLDVPTGPAGPKVTIQREGSRLLMTLVNAPDGLDAGTLGASAAFRNARAKVAGEGMACFGYYNPIAALEMQKGFLEIASSQGEMNSMTDALGAFAESALGNARAVAFASGWKKGDSVTTTYVDFGGQPAGWAYTSAPADRALVGYVPADATSFSIGGMGGSEGFRELLSSADAIMSDPTMKQNVAIWAESEPISHSWLVGENRPLLDAALAGIGDRFLSYSSPLSGSRTLIELDDPAAVQAAATPLVRAIAKAIDGVEEIPVALRAKRESVRAQPGLTVPVYYLRLRTEALPPEAGQVLMFLGQIEPSFAVSPDGWLVASMTRANVRSVVRSGLQPEARSIAENPEAAAFLERVPSNAVQLSWSDPRPGVEQMMTFVNLGIGMAGMNMDPEQLPVDLQKVPTAATINRHLRPSESYTWMDDDGMRSWSRGSFGMADLMAVAGYALPVGAMAALWVRDMQTMPVPEGAAMPAPFEESSPDPMVRTRQELARVQTGILVYDSYHGGPPPSLESLLTERPDGQHYLDRVELGLRADGWGNPLAYRPTADGYILYSFGPNGLDEGGEGDDLTVQD